MNIAELYERKVKEAAVAFADKEMEGLVLPPDEYTEIRDSIYNTFVAGANCAKDIILEIIKPVSTAPQSSRLPQMRTVDLTDKTPEQAEAFISSLGALGHDTDRLRREYKKCGKIQI